MTEAEKISYVQILVSDDTVTENIIKTYLSISAHRIVEKMYPNGNGEGKEMPSKYDLTQCELASRMIMRRGIEGQLGSTENGISRDFQTVDDEDILARVTQIVGVAKV